MTASKKGFEEYVLFIKAEALINGHWEGVHSALPRHRALVENTARQWEERGYQVRITERKSTRRR